MDLDLDHPRSALDPDATDPHAEAVRLRAFGPVVPVELPQGVKAWVTTTDEAARSALTHPLLLKDPVHWRAYQAGEIRQDWPLIALAVGETLLNKDGADHARLRLPVAKAFNRRPVQGYRPRIEEITEELLDQLARLPGDVVDLKAHFAFRLPVAVISELLGIHSTSMRDHLAQSAGVLLNSTATPEQIQQAYTRAMQIMSQLIADKQQSPGQDLTTVLVQAHEQGQLTHQELLDSLFLLVTAGHDTTVNLITNAVHALLTHPEQLALVKEGRYGWDAVVEETMRYDPPVQRIFFRFAVQDMTLAGVPIREGEPIIIGLAAAGRDPEAFKDAQRFDITREAERLPIGFGLGAHYCLGAALARTEAIIALPSLFARFPDLALAAGDGLPRVPSQAMNGLRALPVRLDPAARTVPAA